MAAIANGFSVQDFYHMTIGMLEDALSEKIPDGEYTLTLKAIDSWDAESTALVVNVVIG